MVRSKKNRRNEGNHGRSRFIRESKTVKSKRQ